jgi:hypothetical protein
MGKEAFLPSFIPVPRDVLCPSCAGVNDIPCPSAHPQELPSEWGSVCASFERVLRMAHLGAITEHISAQRSPYESQGTDLKNRDHMYPQDLRN